VTTGTNSKQKGLKMLQKVVLQGVEKESIP